MPTAHRSNDWSLEMDATSPHAGKTCHTQPRKGNTRTAAKKPFCRRGGPDRVGASAQGLAVAVGAAHVGAGPCARGALAGLRRVRFTRLLQRERLAVPASGAAPPGPRSWTTGDGVFRNESVSERLPGRHEVARLRSVRAGANTEWARTTYGWPGSAMRTGTPYAGCRAGREHATLPPKCPTGGPRWHRPHP